MRLLRLQRKFHPHVIKILTWGGLRGGISVALALSIPASDERDIVVAITYVIVVLSILVQGLTIGRLIEANLARGAPRRRPVSATSLPHRMPRRGTRLVTEQQAIDRAVRSSTGCTGLVQHLKVGGSRPH